MSVRNSNTSFESTGRTLNLNKNNLGVLTSIILTLPDFECAESDLLDLDTIVEEMANGNIFPIHKVFEVSPQNKEANYKESQQDFSFRTYRGKNIHQIKYDLRLDYHYLLTQFNNSSLRVFYCFDNKKILAVKNDDNYRGFLLSNITVEDIELFTTNISPIRLEHDDRDENDLMEVVEVDYSLYDIDRRVLNIEIIATSIELTLSVKYLDTIISTLISSEITVNDSINGTLTFSFFNFNGGVYKLTGFSDLLTNGCVSILSEIFVGNQKYRIQAVVSYDVYDTYENGVYETFESGDYELFNTTI